MAFQRLIQFVTESGKTTRRLAVEPLDTASHLDNMAGPLGIEPSIGDGGAEHPIGHTRHAGHTHGIEVHAATSASRTMANS